MRALLIANDVDADPGYIGHALRRRGYAFTELLREQHREWADDAARLAAEHQMVLSLGSGWSVCDPELSAPREAEEGIVRAALASGTPFIGICYGAQVLSEASGGGVERAPEPEIGWCPIEVTSDLREEFEVLRGPWMQWHYDRCLPPPEARILATSPVAVQAFVLPSALGVQFHPEVTEAVVSQWSSGPDGTAELASLGVEPEALIADTRRNVTSGQARCDRIVDWFLRAVCA